MENTLPIDKIVQCYIGEFKLNLSRLVVFTVDAYIFNFYSFVLSNAPIDSTGMKIFNFHPVRNYLNTWSPERYEVPKSYYKTTHKLLKLPNGKRKVGIIDRIVELFES